MGNSQSATNFATLLREGNRRFYHLPVHTDCAQACSYCPATGSRARSDRSLDGVDTSIRKAQSAPYSAFVLPCNLLDYADAEAVLERLVAAKLYVVVQVNRAQLHSALMERLERWLDRFPLVINFVGDGFAAADERVLRELEARALYLYHTLIVHRKMDHLAVFSAFPREWRARIFFSFPYQFIDRRQFYSCLQVHEIVSQLRALDPELQVRPAPGLDPYDPRIPDDRNLEPLIEPKWQLRTEKRNIRISVVIPSYNNRRYLKNTVQHLLRQDLRREEYEIVVVDDGSFDDTEAYMRRVFRDEPEAANFKFIFFPRKQPRRMGDNQFRAGVARNLGVKHTSGEILAFLDSDILVPPHYLRDLLEKHKEWDVIQPKRIQLQKRVSSEFTRYESIRAGRDTYITDEGYWETFQNQTRDWMQLERPWRYVCTYGLSCKRSTFLALGGLRRNYIFYGYEDTELGLDLYHRQCRFLLNDMKVYHLDHRHNRSEFFKSHRRKKLLLAESARTFYLNTLDEGVYNHLVWLYRPFLWLRVMAKDICGPFVFVLKPLERPYYALEYKLRHGHLHWGPLLPLVWCVQVPLRGLRWLAHSRIKRWLLKPVWFLQYQLGKRSSFAGKS